MSDQERYSRLRYAIGEAALQKMLSSAYLVIGMNGYGVEVARNICLSGCASCIVVDDTPIAAEDLEVNFFSTVADISCGATRGAVAARGLNELCGSWCSTLQLSADKLCEFARRGGDEVEEGGCGAVQNVGVVVCCSTESWARALTLELNTRFRSSSARAMKFVLCEAHGVFMALTNDFGATFQVTDPTGLGTTFPPLYATNIRCLHDDDDDGSAASMLLEVEYTKGVDDDGFSPGRQIVLKQASVVCASGVLLRAYTKRGSGGVSAANSAAKIQVEKTNVAVVRLQNSPAVADLARQLGDGGEGYAGGYYLQAVIEPVTVSFRPLMDSLTEPQFTSAMTVEDPGTVMKLFQLTRKHSISELLADSCRLLHEANIFIRASGATETVEGNSSMMLLVKKFLFSTQVHLAPFVTAVGGIVAQEAMKAASGKMMPMTATFLYDLRALIPDDAVATDTWTMPSAMEKSAGKKRPCISLKRIYGEKRVAALQNASVLVVGAGAIGCEYAKILSLVGCGTGPRGSLTFTDNDNIENSNLSRQFLFREAHVGKSKAEVAVAAIRKFDPMIKVRALREKICKETCEPPLRAKPATTDGVDDDDDDDGGIPFGDSFWRKQPILCAAVDNDAARRYLDDLAVRHQLCFADAGTQGALGHVVPIVPKETQRLRDLPSGSGGSDDNRIPFCTLHYFPSTMNHCVQFATDCFSKLFINEPTEVNRFLEFCSSHHTEAPTSTAVAPGLLLVLEDYVVDEMETFDDCLRWARRQFEQIFVAGIRRLLVEKPLDHQEDGKRFWDGRVIPHIVEYSANDSLHVAFVSSAARILAMILGIDASAEESTADERMMIIMKDNIPTNLSEEERQQRAVEAARRVAAGRGRMLRPAEAFDKDQPLHLSFVYSVAAIRAGVFSVPDAPMEEVKRIAGKIIPAMLTTTAVVTGLAALTAMQMMMTKVSALSTSPSPPHVDHQVSLADLSQLFFFQSQSASSNSYLESVSSSRSLQGATAAESSTLPVESEESSSPFLLALSSSRFTAWDTFSISVKQDVSFASLLHGFAFKYRGLEIRQLVDLSTSQLVLDLDQNGEEGEPNSGGGERILAFGVLAWCAALAARQSPSIPVAADTVQSTSLLPKRFVLEFAVGASLSSSAQRMFPGKAVSKKLPILRYIVDGRKLDAK